MLSRFPVWRLLEFGIIGIGLGLLQEMTHTPAHTIAGPDINAAVCLSVRFGQHIGNGAAQAGLFGDI